MDVSFMSACVNVLYFALHSQHVEHRKTSEPQTKQEIAGMNLKNANENKKAEFNCELFQKKWTSCVPNQRQKEPSTLWLSATSPEVMVCYGLDVVVSLVKVIYTSVIHH